MLEANASASQKREEAMEKLREVVEMPLLHPERFITLGIDPPVSNVYEFRPKPDSRVVAKYFMDTHLPFIEHSLGQLFRSQAAPSQPSNAPAK